LTPDPLTAWSWIVVNSSGGKDSQTVLRFVIQAATRAGVALDRIVVSHQDLREMEWPGSLDLARAQATHYGCRFEVSRYRTAAGEEINLLEYIRRRGRWPDASNRYCTSEFKRGPGGRVLTRLSRERPGPILNCYGFRAQESPARARKIAFARNPRFSSTLRPVFDWSPILDWTEDQVWTDIKASQVPHHPAYDHGMRRLSCRFCVLAGQKDLQLSARLNPDLLAEYQAAEAAMGHEFRRDLRIRDLA
jgi:3'-phosphoadenosine 5'-phosphosulfate sulfotransferase (PAPS reductase)/FAD synthetase